MLRAEYDEETGIVTTTAAGICSSDEFDAYVSVMAKLMGLSAARHGHSLHMVDASRNPVQPKDSAEHMAAVASANPNASGYIAYIVGSTLAKMQIKRMGELDRASFFADDVSARTWLLEHADRGAVSAAT